MNRRVALLAAPITSMVAACAVPADRAGSEATAVSAAADGTPGSSGA